MSAFSSRFSEAYSAKAEIIEEELSSSIAYLSDMDGSGNSVDISVSIPNQNVAVSEVFSRVSAAVEVVKNSSKDSSFTLAPVDWLDELSDRMDALASTLVDLRENISSSIQSSGGIKELDSEGFKFTAGNNSVQSIERSFVRLFEGAEGFLEAFHKLLPFLRPSRDVFNFNSAANSLSGLIEQFSEHLASVRKQHRAAREILEAVTESKEEAERLSEATKDSSEEAKQQASEIEKDRQRTSEYLAEVTTERERIQAVSEQAEKLQAKVSDYSAEFDRFDQALEVRLKNFEASSEELNNIEERLSDVGARASDVMTQSENMLKGATVAGLASHYQEIRDKITNDLWWASFSFTCGIIFLFISLLPLLALILTPLVDPVLAFFSAEVRDTYGGINVETTTSGWQFLGQVLARFVILLPAAWYVRFASIKHASLFRLREHYNFKYSMAVSVEGFKQQAPEYEAEIAAITLEQLAFNPADKLTPSGKLSEGRVPHPLLDYLMRLVNRRLNNLSDSPKT